MGRMTTIISLLNNQKVTFMLQVFREAKVSNIIVIATSRACVQNDFDNSLAERNIHLFRLCQTYHEDKGTEEMLSNYNVTNSETPGSLNEAVYKWYKQRVVSLYTASKCNTSHVNSVGDLLLCGYTFSRYNKRCGLFFQKFENYRLQKLPRHVLSSVKTLKTFICYFSGLKLQQRVPWSLYKV